MRLIIEGFNKGLIDEDTITRMGIGQISAGINDQEIRVAGCPATDINAMDFYTRHALNKMNGREVLNTTAWKDSAIIRMYQWQSPLPNEWTLSFSCVSGAVSAAIASVTVSGGTTSFSTISVSGTALTGWAPTIDNMIDIVAYASSAVMTYGDGGLPLALFTGSTYIAPMLGTNAPSGVKTVAAWGSYLFAGNILVGGVRNRSRIVWNQPLDPTSWLASNYIDLDSEDGDVITAMWVLKDVLVVFKKYKTYIVKYVGGISIFDWERIDNAVGCVGPNAICENDGILYFISSDGFYAFDSTRPPYSISDQIENRVNRINSDLEYVCEVDNFDTKGQIFFNVAEGSSTRKNKIYIYDPTSKNWTQWNIGVASISNILYGANLMFIDFPNAYETYSVVIGDAGGAKDSFLAFGTYDGKLQRFGESSNDLGLALDAYWVSPWIDFGYPDRNKRILRATIFVDSTGANNYDIDFIAYKDWNDTTAVITKTIPTSGSSLDIVEKRIDFTLPFRSLKFKLGINQLNATIVIHKIVFEFLIKGRTLVE